MITPTLQTRRLRFEEARSLQQCHRAGVQTQATWLKGLCS